MFTFLKSDLQTVHGIFNAIIDLGGDWGMAMTCDNERCSKSYVQRKNTKRSRTTNYQN